jgi:hypothetical protein
MICRPFPESSSVDPEAMMRTDGHDDTVNISSLINKEEILKVGVRPREDK